MNRLLVIALLVGSACGVEPRGSSADESLSERLRLRGDVAPLVVGSWNVEWFGDPGHGPSDEALQLSNVQRVLAAGDVELWGLSEVVSAASLSEVLVQLPGYDAVLSNDATVLDGAASYSAREQKVALLYRTDLATPHDPRLILTEYANDFAGRPPLVVELTLADGAEITVVVVHLKAMSDTKSYQRRQRAGLALQKWLLAREPAEAVTVIGDWNDDVDWSISGQPSPFAPLVDDPEHARFVTAPLSDAGVASTVFGSQMVDHHLVNAAWAERFMNESTVLVHPEVFIDGYAHNTSDHFPVVSRYLRLTR